MTSRDTAIIDEPMSAPNVVMIVLDDLGFAQLGCYGAEIATPNIDRLADGGLRYNSFHVTSLCGPTRASLVTGRNHHAVGMGIGPEVPMDFAGYTGGYRSPPELSPGCCVTPGTARWRWGSGT